MSTMHLSHVRKTKFKAWEPIRCSYNCIHCWYNRDKTIKFHNTRDKTKMSKPYSTKEANVFDNKTIQKALTSRKRMPLYYKGWGGIRDQISLWAVKVSFQSWIGKWWVGLCEYVWSMGWTYIIYVDIWRMVVDADTYAHPFHTHYQSMVVMMHYRVEFLWIEWMYE